MKKIALFISVLAIIASCQNQEHTEDIKREPAPDTVVADGVYGKEFDASNPISMDSLEVLMASGKEIENIKVTGIIKEVCQAEGCWLTVQKKDGNGMRVSFNDHAFFVPKNIAGKTATFEGKAFIETTSVEDLRHYAEDEGKSKDEIAKITEPSSELVFDAHGVVVQ
jgi:hypothetical protein